MAAPCKSSGRYTHFHQDRVISTIHSKNLQNIPACAVVLQKDEALMLYILNKQKEKSIVLMADKSITATIKAAEGLKHSFRPQ